MNRWSLWTPPLWGRESTTRSCTVCTLILNLQWLQPLLHPGGCVLWSTIQRNEFPWPSSDISATFREASPMRIAAMQKNLEFRQWHRQQHLHILDYTGIGTRTIDDDLPLSLSRGGLHRPRDYSSISTFTLTPTHTQLLEHPPPYNRLWALAVQNKGRSTLALHLSSGSLHRHGETSPMSRCHVQQVMRISTPWLTQTHTGLQVHWPL